MLRCSFLPSDYHPMVLILGESSDMLTLSAILKAFSQSPRDLDFSKAAGFAPTDTQITLSSADPPLGLVAVSKQDKIFRWSLDRWSAELFAELIEELANGDLKSGSERLVCGLEDEIPVKVSRGEFTDDYLIQGRRTAQR
jgi:hypothetical protein